MLQVFFLYVCGIVPMVQKTSCLSGRCLSHHVPLTLTSVLGNNHLRLMLTVSCNLTTLVCIEGMSNPVIRYRGT